GRTTVCSCPPRSSAARASCSRRTRSPAPRWRGPGRGWGAPPVGGPRRRACGEAARAEQAREPISVARCRELLGDEADTLSDQEVLIVARHAESLAHGVIDLVLADGPSPYTP